TGGHRVEQLRCGAHGPERATIRAALPGLRTWQQSTGRCGRRLWHGDTSMNIQSIVFAAVCALAWSGFAQADDKELAQAIDDASQDLAQNQWRDAQDELQKARKDFDASQDENLRATYGFYSAVVNHQCADDPKVAAAQRAKARTQAIADYENYLKWNKNSGGALNNLAQLYAQDPAEQVRALKLYDLAVNLKDDRAGVYAVNRAKLQSQMGQGDAALQSSRDALRRDPANEAAQELSLALLEKGGRTADIGEFVREL